MPFKSRAQLRKFGSLLKQGKIKASTFEEFLSSTKNISKLPERIGKKKSKKRKK